MDKRNICHYSLPWKAVDRVKARLLKRPITYQKNKKFYQKATGSAEHTLQVPKVPTGMQREIKLAII